MKIKFEKSTDSAYIQLVDEIGAGGVARTYACDPLEVQGMINLDFNSLGELVGIEVLGASSKLPASLLGQSPA